MRPALQQLQEPLGTAAGRANHTHAVLIIPRAMLIIPSNRVRPCSLPARAPQHMGCNACFRMLLCPPVIRLHRDAACKHRTADRVDVGWRLRRVRVACSLCARVLTLYGLERIRLAVFMFEFWHSRPSLLLLVQ